MPALHASEAEGSKPEGDPDLYISKTNPYPETYAKGDWDCSTQGTDICSIGHENIKTNDIFYIGVRCYKPCSFRLFPQLLSLNPIEDGVPLEIDFRAQETKLFTFYIAQG